MASQLVNVNSALTYLSAQTGLSLSIIRGWFPNETANRSKPLNIKSAVNILARMIKIGFGVDISSPVNSAYDKYACSANTFKALYTKVMNGRTWNLKTATNQLQYGHWYMPLVENITISGSAKGGDGGGSGSVYGAATYNVTSGAGASGGKSYIIRKNVSTEATTNYITPADGGAGGSGKNVSGGKSAGALNGNAGTIATPVNYSFTAALTYALGFFPGYGGGGSCGVRSPNTYTGPSAVKATGSSASEAAGATGSSTQGGGGGGASGYDGATKVWSGRGSDFEISKTMNYPSETGGAVINATIGSSANGGRGGDQAETTGSLEGIYVSNSGRSGGGNGGNSGYITITSITNGFIFNDIGGV